jgi:hypothetical protein
VTIDYARHQSSLNSSQSVADADGSTTYVVSIKDPGVYNWLDPAGLHELLVMHRWQGLPRGVQVDPGALIESRKLKLKDLPSVLPKGIKMVTPDERRRQLDERYRSFLGRWVDR